MYLRLYYGSFPVNKLTFKPINWIFASMGFILALSVVELISLQQHPDFYCDSKTVIKSDFYRNAILPLGYGSYACD